MYDTRTHGYRVTGLRRIGQILPIVDRLRARDRVSGVASHARSLVSAVLALAVVSSPVFIPVDDVPIEMRTEFNMPWLGTDVGRQAGPFVNSIS